jgi:alkanesulfonate monooxygenase SsuD/methylene tetrahydromethanopterin reductase-like flavin-dependent oxidoreductase (luciferase family)
MKMKFDISLSPFDISVADLVAAARVAEAEGFDGVWTYDHVSGAAAQRESVLDPWIVLSAIAGGTERIGLGPLVLNATARHPAHIAVAAATLQELSGGRLTLGMGAGAGADRYGTELAMVGIPRWTAAERRDRTEEAVGVVRALWRGKPFLEGSHHRLVEAAGFRRPDPEPQIVIGANGPKMAALAGRVADAVNFHWFEDDLEGLAAIARRTSGRHDFAVTVEAPLDHEWLAGDGRARLERLAVSRVMYQWNAAIGTSAIVEAAAVLRSQDR